MRLARGLRALAMVLAILPLGGCAGEPPAPVSFQTLELREISGLRGGQVLFLRADGSGVCQRLARGGAPDHPMLERRQVLALGADALRELDALLLQRHVAALAIAPRAALPGAVLRAITVRLADGSVHRAALWAGDRHEDFEAVYRACLEILEDCRAAPLAYEGPYDDAWLPPGF